MLVSVVDSEFVRCDIALGLGSAVPVPRLLARAEAFPEPKLVARIAPGLASGIAAESTVVLCDFGEQDANAARCNGRQP